MKKIIAALLLITCSFTVRSQSFTSKAFRFAFLSDTHIGSPNGGAEEDLRRSVRDINAMDDIAFVVITGDITELGTNEELKLAKRIFDSLKVKYYIIPGNHDSGWSESGCTMFTTVFGYDKFSFEFEGIRFLGCPSGPYVRMSDGHVPRSSVNWLKAELETVKSNQPVVFLNHYPMDDQMDNWYEITTRLHQYNTWAILCGHGHTNKALNFEDIPGVMGRSNLRAKAAVGGYNLVDVTADSMIFSERRPGIETLKPWTKVKIETRNYDQEKKYKRPDFTMNDTYNKVNEQWRYTSDANVISTPAVKDDWVIFGNQDGKIAGLSLKTGKTKWLIQVTGSIFSSPAIEKNAVVLGSTNGNIYCLDLQTGKQKWEAKTGAAVMGCPLIQNNIVYIGGSDHHFRALDLSNGKTIWDFDGLNGPVVSTPVLYKESIIFGAWDTYLYSLDSKTGHLQWKWTNGSPIRNYSPASCIPVIKDDVIYVVAPDRYITAIEAADGKTLWRNNDATIRESIGISEDGKWIYGKTMQDTIVAYATSRDKQFAAWKMHCGFGYEHVPSMLIEKQGQVFFGTRSGVVYAIDPAAQKLVWSHKIDNSMVNTVKVLDKQHVIASTMDGKVVLLEVKN